MSDFNPARHPARERVIVPGRPGEHMGGGRGNLAVPEPTPEPEQVETFTVTSLPDPEPTPPSRRKGAKVADTTDGDA